MVVTQPFPAAFELRRGGSCAGVLLVRPYVVEAQSVEGGLDLVVCLVDAGEVTWLETSDPEGVTTWAELDGGTFVCEGEVYAVTRIRVEDVPSDILEHAPW